MFVAIDNFPTGHPFDDVETKPVKYIINTNKKHEMTETKGNTFCTESSRGPTVATSS